MVENMTPYRIAERYIGVKELVGHGDHPAVQFWLSLCGFPPDVADETPWCSAFVNFVMWQLYLPHTKSAGARSWLAIGQPIKLQDAIVGNDIVILQRGAGAQPGPSVIDAPGHVGFYAGHDSDDVYLLGGNQGNQVSVQSFLTTRILGVRRVGRY